MFNVMLKTVHNCIIHTAPITPSFHVNGPASMSQITTLKMRYGFPIISNHNFEIYELFEKINTYR